MDSNFLSHLRGQCKWGIVLLLVYSFVPSPIFAGGDKGDENPLDRVAKRNLFIGTGVSSGAALLGVIGIILSRGRTLNKLKPRIQDFIKKGSYLLAVVGSGGLMVTGVAALSGGYKGLFYGEDDEPDIKDPEKLLEMIKRRQENREFQRNERPKQHEEDMKLLEKEHKKIAAREDEYAQAIKGLKDAYAELRKKLRCASAHDELTDEQVKEEIDRLQKILENSEGPLKKATTETTKKMAKEEEAFFEALQRIREDIETEREGLMDQRIERALKFGQRHLDADIKAGVEKMERDEVKRIEAFKKKKEGEGKK